LGDRHGRKGMFMLGVASFAVGSLISGLAPTVAILLVGRIVQGVGPALLVPNSLAIVTATFDDPRQRALAIGFWSTSSGLALALGAPIGGAIVNVVGWRWVFLLNVPLSVGLILAAARFVPRINRSSAHTSFDWLGLIMSTVGVAALTLGIIDGQNRGWTSSWIIFFVCAGVAALLGFVLWERRLVEPLIDVALFQRPSFVAANVAALVAFFSFVGALVYFSAYFQQVQGHSPMIAGLDLSAIGVAFALAAPLSGRIVGRVGARRPMLAGLLICGAATLGLLRLQPDTSIDAIWWNFAIMGGAAGLCFTPMTTIAVSGVPASRAGMASAIHNATRQLGQVLGVAVLGALVNAYLPTGISAGRLDPSKGALFVAGLHNALWVSGLALRGTAVLAALLLARHRVD
jgi:DHA2 family methylenomycin A resistance protein-like MFS transporter